jgi:integrase
MPRRDSAEDPPAIAAIRLLAFTGARLSEILTLQWAWIHTAQGPARLPDSKTGRVLMQSAAGDADAKAVGDIVLLKPGAVA